MKQFASIFATITLSTLTAFAGQGEQTTIESVYTDLNKECIVVEAATENAEIDFFTSECKSFGGFQLSITGGDVRYHPELSYGGQNLNLPTPGHFHDLGSDKVEWMYRKTTSLQDGSGSLTWLGFIYSLNVDNGQGTDSNHIIYAVRLDGANTCMIGTATTNEQARSLVQNSKPGCK
jgi:hypothetical protein